VRFKIFSFPEILPVSADHPDLYGQMLLSRLLHEDRERILRKADALKSRFRDIIREDPWVVLSRCK